MVGFPTNTNIYAPLRDDPGIRKISLCNFSLGQYVLDFNNPACVLLDISDLGFSYDINVTPSGMVSRKVKDKDIVLKILINYKERATTSGTYVDWDATTYDALNDFLAKLGTAKTKTTTDRRGIFSKDVPDLVLKWDTPSKSGVKANSSDPYGVLSRYRDVVISDVQWTEVDKQYQGIIVDLTLKPIGPWYYRRVFEWCDVNLGTSYASIPGTGSLVNRQILKAGVLPEDADLQSPIKYDIGLKVNRHSSSTANAFGSIQFRHSINISDVQAVYMNFDYSSTVYQWSHFGNLRNVPYIINGDRATWCNLLPGSPNEMYLLPEVNANDFYIQARVDGVSSPNVDFKIEYDIPILV